MNVCKLAAKIIGWDVVPNSKGEIEIIEGNHRPDAYGLQTPIKKGFKSHLKFLLND